MANKKVFTVEIDGIKQAITNVNELKKSQEELQEAFEKATFGTEEYAKLSKQLQEVNTRLVVIDESVSDITGADRVDGWVKFGSAIGGAFGTAAVAAQAFGASSEEIEKVQMKFGVLISTLETLKLVQEAVGKENKLFTSFMNRLAASTEASTAATGKASIAQKALNFVMKANPIGLVITALGILIGLFAVVANNADTLKKKFAPLFEFLEAGFNKILDVGRDVLNFLSGGLINDAATAKTIDNVNKIISAVEKAEKANDRINVSRESQIKLLEAVGGKETEIFNIRLKQLAEEYRLNDQKFEQLKELQRLGEKTVELDGQSLDIQEAIFKVAAEGNRIVTETKLLKIEEAKRNEESLKNEKKLQEEQSKAALEALKSRKALLESLQPIERKFDELNNQRFDLLVKLRSATEKYNEELAKGGQASVTVLQKQKDTIEQIQQQIKDLDEVAKKTVPEIKVRIKADLDTNISPAMDPSFAEKVTKYLESIDPQIKDAVGNLAGSTIDFVDTIFQNSITRAEEALSRTQEQIQQVDQQLADSQANQEAAEEKLKNATGARREYLIAQIEKEKKKETELNSQKIKLAAEEEKRAKEIEKKRKQRAAIQKGLDIAQAVARTALAVITALGPPPTGLGPIAGIPLAILTGATGAVQIATIAATQYALGGLLPALKTFSKGGLLQGSSHSEGGIPFTVNGVPGFEAEGGETIINKRSSAMFKDQLSEINSYNGWGVKFAAGGVTAAPVVQPAPVINNNFNQDLLVDKLDALIIETQKVNSTPVQLDVRQVSDQQNRIVEIQDRGTV